MPDSPIRILIVDDDPAIRMSMQLVLDELGYSVRSAAGGFAALREIRQEMPDILLADLNMPGMSGVELLAIVWRRFPAIQKIAMGGVYPGNVAPSGVAAEAFFQKSQGVGELVRIIQGLPPGEHHARQRFNPSAPLRIHIDGHAGSSKACVTIDVLSACELFPACRRPERLHDDRRLHPLRRFDSIRNRRPSGPHRLRQLKRVTSATLRVDRANQRDSLSENGDRYHSVDQLHSDYRSMPRRGDPTPAPNPETSNHMEATVTTHLPRW